MYKEFNKKFKITNFNLEIPTSSTGQPNQSTTNSNDVNSNNQPKVISYNTDGSEIYDNQQPEQQPTQQQRVVPQTFNDVLQGKGFLKFGDKSPAVKELQEKLISIDYTVISRATGYFGNETRTAVQYFQNNSNLKPDLIVGKNTALALNNAVQLRQRRNQQQTQLIPSVQRGVPQSNIQAPTTGIQR
jgi:peptidoglycan hydrolase-like protein with peptidoglycan-binding domain